MTWFAWLLGLDAIDSIERAELFLAAPWVQRGMFWLFLAVVLSYLAAFYYYRKLEQRGSKGARSLLGVLRGSLLALLVITLATPFIRLTTKQSVRPTIRFLFDGTESMLTEDAVPQTVSDGRRVTRLAAVQSALRQASSKLASLDCRVEAYRFDGLTTSRLSKMPFHVQGGDSILEDHLTATGKVTSLGDALTELTQIESQADLAAVVMFSDFAHNAGPSPMAEEVLAAITSLNAPLHTVGVGEPSLVDLSVDLRVQARMKKDEQALLLVTVASTGMAGQTVDVSIAARRIEKTAAEPTDTSTIVVARRDVELTTNPVELAIPFIPTQTGVWEFTATASRLPGEVVYLNNSMSRRSTAIDDFLRMLYVAFEPNWEWRFVKEAFHRDRLVGIEGFRTYLDSSDPRVRRDNPLFLETLPTRRDSLFSHDILLLDDLPEAALSEDFCELVEEFVGKMGGGLVILAGPRFGPHALSHSKLAEMLPVAWDQPAAIRDRHGFVPRLTAQATAFAFMQLGDTQTSSATAWGNLGEIPWYQPVDRVHEQALVLSEHPSDICINGKTKQPIIAIRKYGKGEVVYVAFNELWRLRRGRGERFHRQFWSQLIYRLGMSHALGDEKRFVVQADREQYQIDDVAVITVDAYDDDYQPLRGVDLTDNGLTAVLIHSSLAQETPPTEFTVPAVRDGVFEARVPVPVAGSYEVQVLDPITARRRQVQFTVTDATAEQLDPVRNTKIQQELALRTGGRSYDLGELDRLIDELSPTPIIERREWTRSLWNTPLWFIMIVGLMLSEWMGRRWIHLK